MSDVDLGARESVQDPAGYFRAARARGGDVQWSDAQRGWALLSHAEVEAGFRDAETLSADRTGVFARAAARHSPAFARVTELLSGWMNFRDDPAHQRLREPVSAAFTPRAVTALEPAIREVVERTLDGFAGDTVELHEAFSRPIPAVVIALLLGVEPGDRARFQHWSDELAAIVFSLDPKRVDEAPLVAATDRFVAYFSALIERERAAPSGNLLSAMVHSEAGSLATLELVGACTLLLFGGHETTTNLLDNALALLLERADLADRLRAEPSLWPSAVEELMRAIGPARTMARKVARAHERGGRKLWPGETLFLSIAAANHDERVFERPAEIDLARAPNPHLGFGWGPHYCLGANLARLEARVALSTLLERHPKLAPAEPISPRAGGVMGFAPRRIVARLR
jgi:cytochrome P450